MGKSNQTKPLAMAFLFAVVFAAGLVGIKLFVFSQTGTFSERDAIEVAVLVGAIFVGAFLQFFFEKKK